MTQHDLLTRYCAERKELLAHITTLLENDPRLVAAWLFGSLGRGEEDELSDLDVWVVVADERIQEIVSRRRHFAAQVGKPLLFVEAPHNAPEAGGYLMAHYDAPAAPHQVDWYWQPQSLAVRWPGTRLLFDRVGVPTSNEPIVFRQGEIDHELIEKPRHFIGFFWTMLMITAKYAARSPWAEKMELLQYTLPSLHKAQRFIGLEAEAEITPHPTPLAKLQCLRRVAAQMEALMPIIVERGGQVPTAIVPAAYRFLNLVEFSLEKATQTE